MRRSWLGVLTEVAKRYQIAAAANNLGRLLWKLLGIGKPRRLQGRSGAWAALCAALRALFPIFTRCLNQASSTDHRKHQPITAPANKKPLGQRTANNFRLRRILCRVAREFHSDSPCEWPSSIHSRGESLITPNTFTFRVTTCRKLASALSTRES